jgi:hypothetical protein
MSEVSDDVSDQELLDAFLNLTLRQILKIIKTIITPTDMIFDLKDFIRSHLLAA